MATRARVAYTRLSLHRLRSLSQPLPPDRAKLACRRSAPGCNDLEILALIAQGLPNSDIAARLFMTENTVKSHVRNAYRKIGAASRSQAVAWAMRNGFAPPEA